MNKCPGCQNYLQRIYELENEIISEREMRKCYENRLKVFLADIRHHCGWLFKREL